MQSSLRSTATLFLINALIFLFLVPRPVPSFPMVALKRCANRRSHASGPSHMHDELVFDIAFAFAPLLAFLCIWVCVARRVTVSRFVTRINLLLLSPSTSISQVLPFRLGAFLQTATAAISGANGGRTSTRPGGGFSPPISSVPLAQPQRAGFVRSSATPNQGGASRTVERNLRVGPASFV